MRTNGSEKTITCRKKFSGTFDLSCAFARIRSPETRVPDRAIPKINVPKPMYFSAVRKLKRYSKNAATVPAIKMSPYFLIDAIPSFIY